MSIAGWLPPEWSKAIVPIAVQTETDRYAPIGTAFLVVFSGFNCLITAKHVVFEDSRPRMGLFMLNNLQSGGIMPKSFDEFATGGANWIAHPEKDMAATICPMNPKTDDFKIFTENLFEDFANIKEGDDVFFLGFPLGIVVPTRITPIVRGGMIALKRDDDTFLIDANVFVGNSGSPVFFKPSPFQMGPEGMSLGKVRPPKLIGVISAYIPYTDVAISPQTKRARITFEENSGLAEVSSVRFIRETLNSQAFQNMLQHFRELHRIT